MLFYKFLSVVWRRKAAYWRYRHLYIKSCVGWRVSRTFSITCYECPDSMDQRLTPCHDLLNPAFILFHMFPDLRLLLQKLFNKSSPLEVNFSPIKPQFV